MENPAYSDADPPSALLRFLCLQASQLLFELQQILTRWIHFFQIGDRLLGRLRIAFSKCRRCHARKWDDIVTLFQERCSIPFLGNIEMTRVQIHDSERQQSLIIVGLQLIGFEEELNRGIVSLDSVVEFSGL